MPATAGRVRMPADNRISVSASLKTSEIWQKSVRYDPYAPTDLLDGNEHNFENSEKAKGLFTLARLTGSSSSVTPGACKKCGQIGHLTHQCRNILQIYKSKIYSNQKEKKKIKSDSEDENLLRKRFGIDSDSSSKSSSISSSSSSSDSSKRNYKHRKRERSNKKKTYKNSRKKKSSSHHQRSKKKRRKD